MTLHEFWPTWCAYLQDRWPNKPTLRANYQRWVTNRNMPTERLHDVISPFGDWLDVNMGGATRTKYVHWLRQWATLGGD